MKKPKHFSIIIKLSYVFSLITILAIVLPFWFYREQLGPTETIFIIGFLLLGAVWGWIIAKLIIKFVAVAKYIRNHNKIQFWLVIVSLIFLLVFQEYLSTLATTPQQTPYYNAGSKATYFSLLITLLLEL